MLCQCLIILFFLWVLQNRWKNRKLIKLSKQLKSEAPCMPLIGHAYKCFGNDEVQMKAIQYFGRDAIKHSGIGSCWLGNKLVISIADPVNAEFIAKNYLEKGYVMKCVRSVTGNGSILAPVPIWRPRRKILIPTFKPKNLQKFAKIFANQSAIMSDQLQSRVGAIPFSIWNYLTTYTMDSVCETTLGINLQTQKNQHHPFLEAFEKGSKIIGSRVVTPWQHNDTLYKLFPSYHKLENIKKYLNNFFNEIIVSKRKELQSKNNICEKNNKKENDTKSIKSFLELLIESSGGMTGYTDEELKEEVQVLVMAGTDTSAVATGYTMLMLARYPDVQQKVYEELQEVFGDSSRLISPEDLLQLKYLEAVIKESLRLYPPVPVIVRNADRDLTLPSGITLVKDCTLLIHIWALNRNPRYWGDDAEEFKPERWLQESPLKHPAQYMVFSYGPRNCVGYQYAMSSAKTAISTILRRYRILPDADKNGGLKQLRFKFDIMMKDVDNFMVRLENRV